MEGGYTMEAAGAKEIPLPGVICVARLESTFILRM